MYERYLKQRCFDWKTDFKQVLKRESRANKQWHCAKAQGRENILWATSNHPVFAKSLSYFGKIKLGLISQWYHYFVL